jgi:hypothetical protein
VNGLPGLELQDALAVALSDPIGDDLDALEPEALQRLIRDHDKTDVQRFMNDHRVPARKVDLVAARRVLPRVRGDRNGRRTRTVRWLTSVVASMVHNALVTAVGSADAKKRHAGVDLDAVIADYGAPAVRLAVFADWGTQSCELNLAMLIVDGRAVPDRWRPHLDRLRPVAEGIVGEFAETHQQHSVESHDVLSAFTSPADDDLDDLEDVVEEPEIDGLGEADHAEEQMDLHRRTERELTLEEQAESERPGGDGNVDTQADAIDPFVAAQTAALAALDALEAATARFARAVAAVTLLVGPAARLASARAATPGAVTDEDLEELRTFASGPLDAENAAFLDALTTLAELTTTSGSGDAEVMAAEETVRRFAAAHRLRPIVFAAARGRLILGTAGTVDARLTPWVGTGSELTVPAPVRPADIPVAPASTVPVTDDEAELREPIAAEETATTSPHEPTPKAAAPAEDSTPAGTGTPATEASAAAGPAKRVGKLPSAAAVPPVQAPPRAEARAMPPVETAAPVPTEPSGTSTGPFASRAPSTHTATPQPPPADTEPDEHDDYDGDYGQMLANGRWGLARWLARTLGDTARADALEAVAYADAARSATGTLAAALTSKLDAFSPHRIGGDRPAQILAVAAATRAAVVTPFSDVTPALTLLAGMFYDDAPAVAAIADAAVESARHGVAFTGAVIATLGGAAAVDSKIADASADAERQLTRIGRTGYSRADRIWGDWVAAGGPINELLAPVAANDTAAVAAVRAAVFAFRKDSVQQQIVRESDDRHRGPGKPRLEGPPRTALLGRFDRAIGVASTWLELQHATAATERANDHEAAVAARLRDVIVAQRVRLDATLAAWASSDDPVLAGAARGAVRLYRDTFALTQGVQLPGDEQDINVLLDVDLLRTNIPFGPDLTPIDPAAVTADAVVTAVNRSWEDAFATRAAADDHLATAAIVSTVAATDPARATALMARRSEALADARRRIAAGARELSALLQAARRSGRANEDTATALAARIERADDSDREDLGVAAAELDAVASALEDAAATEVVAFQARLEEAAAASPAVAAAAGRFETLLADRDLATAEELLLQLQEGLTQPTEHRPTVDFGDFFPAVIEHLANGITPALIERARRREVDGPLDFRALSPEAALSAAAALEAWRTVAVGERQQRKAQILSAALRALGLEFRNERTANLPASNDRVWIDLTGVVRVPQTLVPAFGTYAGDAQRLLLVWKQPGESLLEWVEQDVSERAVLVLYFGTMSTEVRRKVANRLRGRHARPVAIVDDAVVAWAASLGHQTFEVTMRATLPFLAVNPYEPDIAGSVPDEMFYGRVVERSQVMSDTGTSLIYGGRRLGKSALLRAAERRFTSIAGQEAIYIDLSAAGIRNTKRPEAVWDLIAARLVEIGIAERPNAGRTTLGPFERADRAVRAWLAGGDSRRLLLLLDESDDFFDVDADTDFTQTRRLKELMESTGRRVKVVFAGLHQVARFASYPNQPLAHLGRPLPIGPLAPQYAHNLIAKPLTALGWRFESENLINRALTYCNYTPILLQVFGHTLVEHLHARRIGEGEPPSMITTVDIDAVLGSPSLEHAIRSRFDLTLSLDPRYKMIAYVLALETLSGSNRSTVSASMTASALRDECIAWWPDGFATVGNDEFRALLDELVGLGVLSPDRGAWRMRSPNVLRLLGTRDAIERGLMELVRENPTTGGMFSGEAHRHLELPDGTATRSPFTEQQLADVIGEGRDQLRLVVGTAATGANDVRATLAATRDVLGRWELVTPRSASVFEQSAADVPARHHRVVFSDLRRVSDESVVRTIVATAKPPTKPGATRAAVLLIDPGMLPVVEDAVSGIGIEDVAVVPLRRYSTQSLRAWAVEVESGFTDDDARRRLREVTGGWPVLVAEAERLAKESNAYRAITEIEASLPGRADWFLAQVGLDDPAFGDAWSTAVEVLGDGAEPTDALGPFLAEDSAAGEALTRALVAAGVIDDTEGILSVEPVTAAAWQRTVAPS